MKKLFMFVVLLGGFGVRAQTCEGGLYLNPQVIRGEGSAQADVSSRELIEFVRPSGLPLLPVVNIKDVQDVLGAIKRPVPPCWVYGNPVAGLSSGYRPVSVNVDPIQSAVLILSDVGKVKDAKPVELQALSPAEQTRILTKLKTTACLGIKSGATTALVKAEKLCGEVVEVAPQQGLGQNFLPTKAAFQWQANKWVGLVTRLSSARSATMQNQFGTDERVHFAQLLIVPTSGSSWGYGLYVHPGVASEPIRKVSGLFASMKNPNAALLRALDLGGKYEFSLPSEVDTKAMIKTLAIGS